MRVTHNFSPVGRAVVSRVGLANGVGAIVFGVYSLFLEPEAAGGEETALELAIVIAIGCVAMAVGAWRSTVIVRRAHRWIREKRAPSEQERRATLSVPLRLAVLSLAIWAIVAVTVATAFALLGDTSIEIARTAIGVLDSGLVTCAAVFLLAEQPLRPSFAAALAYGPPHRSLSLHGRLLVMWALGSGVPLLMLGFCAIGFPADQRAKLAAPTAFLAVAALVAGAAITSWAARSVADPIRAVREGLQRIENGDLDVAVPVDDGSELGVLEAGFNRMAAGLRERARLRDLFGRHVGDEVAALAIDQSSGLGGSRREASALFIDLIGSSAMAEVLPPEAVVETLNAFFGAVVDAVSAEGGWVNKFEGDGALCVFGAPADQPDHSARALRAARTLRERVTDLEQRYPGLDAAVGVSSGPVVAGNVGTERRYEYTVIGRAVNEAARLSELAKGNANRVLASGGSIDRAGDEARNWTGVGTVALRGHSVPTTLYEPTVRVTA